MCKVPFAIEGFVPRGTKHCGYAGIGRLVLRSVACARDAFGANQQPVTRVTRPLRSPQRSQQRLALAHLRHDPKRLHRLGLGGRKVHPPPILEEQGGDARVRARVAGRTAASKLTRLCPRLCMQASAPRRVCCEKVPHSRPVKRQHRVVCTTRNGHKAWSWRRRCTMATAYADHSCASVIANSTVCCSPYGANAGCTRCSPIRKRPRAVPPGNGIARPAG